MSVKWFKKIGTRRKQNKPDVATRKRWRKILFEAQHGDCAICGRPMLAAVDPYDPFYPTFDHMVCQAEGGRWEIRNLRLTHRFCNSERGSKPMKRIKPIIESPAAA